MRMISGQSLDTVYDLYSQLDGWLQDPQHQEIIQVLHNQFEYLLEISRRTLKTELDDAILFECRQLRRIVIQIKKGVEFSRDQVENLKEKIHSSTPGLKMLEEQCCDGLYDSFLDDEMKEEEGDHGVSTKIVGLSDVYQKLKDSLMSDKIVTSLNGMPGIGKTTLANKVFHDPTIVECFDRRVWVRVGKRCRFKDIPLRILAEMDPGVVHVDEKLKLKERLESERCLVVLDDVWDGYMTYFLTYFWDEHHFLHSRSGSRILVISRLQQQYGARQVRMRLMDKDESWKLLCQKVFSKGLCPRELEKAGKKIAENCEGLPLTIVAVAALLSQLDCTPEYWDEVAAKKDHQVFKDAYDQISEVLLPSYTYLPRILQTCFLYMGLFPQNYKIPRSKLINLWRADGFSEINLNIDVDRDAVGCLEELDLNNLVMVYQKSTWAFDHSVKTCGLHSSLWHLSNKKARESKFSIILNNLNDCLDDDIKTYRRLSFHNNVLFGIKDAHESVETNCASTARSLLCYGPYHQYQVPLCFHLELLRELDAVSIRIYEFPIEVLQLVELRYLTLTLNGMIPPSISQLSKLQFLIVGRHLNVKSAGNCPSYLPIEIWELKELKHLEVMGNDLPDPSGASLKSLSTMLNVSALSCTEAVFKAIPYMKELRIRIELASSHDRKLMNCFTHISHLQKLDYLKLAIVNPGVARPIVPFSSFPKFLNNLSLSGLRYQWKDMSKIALLPNLYVLKLKNYAFQGPVWEVEESGFSELKSLVIEDTDLMDWRFGYEGFRYLSELRMRHCYGLKKIHGDFGVFLGKIELVDCNPLSVHELKKAIPERNKDCVVDAHFSWDETKLQT